jgi:farnesyl diphosphate synthase
MSDMTTAENAPATENFRHSLAEAARQVETALDALLRPGHPLLAGTPERLLAAMRHGVLNGGKRLRAFLVLECARATAGPESAGPEGAMDVAAALELLHAYSLIHDDLPSMDNDDVRRGQPTVHRAFDEATAILAGDALLTLSFGVLAAAPGLRDEARVALVAGLARQAGAAGMVGGQLLDLAAEGRFGAAEPATGGNAEAGVRRIQAMKTGALIAFACEAGCIVAAAGPEQRQAVMRYAQGLGLAFQIKDDLLDAEGDMAQLGKAAGKDAAAGKATFVSLRGAEGARAALAAESAAALAALAPLGDGAALLAAALTFNSQRRS